MFVANQSLMHRLKTIFNYGIRTQIWKNEWNGLDVTSTYQSYEVQSSQNYQKYIWQSKHDCNMKVIHLLRMSQPYSKKTYENVYHVAFVFWKVFRKNLSWNCMSNSKQRHHCHILFHEGYLQFRSINSWNLHVVNNLYPRTV